uniref:PWWP domain-containing protein n=1 Tax=Triticum urartu TaxID=4572 RepID=A0A8R7R4K7_TRIUA
MAPAAKRGAKGTKWNRDPQLGDLVLAKVKGYPFWPAKVSRPEDWNQEPTPRKFFVLFFGTKEMRHQHSFVVIHTQFIASNSAKFIR